MVGSGRRAPGRLGAAAVRSQAVDRLQLPVDGLRQRERVELVPQLLQLGDLHRVAQTAGQQPITNFDNTTRTSLNIKGIYNADRHWEFTAGYSREEYRYSDIGYDNTQYFVQAAAATQNSYVTGQFSYQPYTADIVYFVTKYKY